MRNRFIFETCFAGRRVGEVFIEHKVKDKEKLTVLFLSLHDLI